MLKHLWIMRHGLAESRFESDFSRDLSEVGKTQALSVANKILAGEPKPTEMLVSPFARTQQTAQIVHHALGLSKPFITESMLVHTADPKMLGDYILGADFSHLILVSHMPIVAELSLYLAPDCGLYGFQTAQVAHFEIIDGGAPKLRQLHLA